MNAPSQSGKTLSLRDAVAEKVNDLVVGQSITVKEITESLRRDVNSNVITLNDIDINNPLDMHFYPIGKPFERQTVTYADVKDTFLSVIDAKANISWTLDSTNTFRIYRKEAPPTATGQKPWDAYTNSSIQTYTAPPGPSVLVTTPVPPVPAGYVPPLAVKSFVERVLEGSITHVFQVELNGHVIVVNKQGVFDSKAEAISAVKNRLYVVLGLTGKELDKELKLLTDQGKLRYTKSKI